MDITISFCLGALIFVGCCALALWMTTHKQQRGMLDPLNVLFAGVLFSAVVLFVPGYFAVEPEGPFQFIKSVLFAFYSAIRLFAAEGDYTVIYDVIEDTPVTSLYLTLTAVLMVMAPALTFGVVLSVVGNLSSTFRYLKAYFRDAYVFSELNEQSLTLAADLKNNHPGIALVFTDVFEPDGDNAYELQERARELGAILFQKDILSVKFGLHAPESGLWFFAIAQDESANIDHALQLAELYGDRENSHLYVFSTGSEGEALLNAIHGRTMKVRRVDQVQSLISRILYDDGQVLFENARPEADGTKTISAVVVGMGKHGAAMVRALSWFCQMDGYRVRINGFDMDELAEDRFCARCPELMDPKYNGVYVDGEAQYYIRIHSGLEVDTKTFADRIQNLKDATYVLVALGDDSLNIQTALRLRMLFEQIGTKPAIQAIIMSSDKRRALEGLTNYRGQPYNIDFIGDLESSYSEKVIIDSELEDEALRRHLRWGKEAEFWGYEYNYRSSVALAIHARAKVRCGIAGAAKPEDQLTDQERTELETLEHRRWNAYMRSEGYIYSGSPDKSSRNDLGKMHHDLVNFDDLSDEEKRKDSRVGSA